VVVAILTGESTTLIEPRRLRAEFLRRVVAELDINATVSEAKVERTVGNFDNITARAVAETSKLFAMAEHVTHRGTRWVLPKGRSAKKELEAAQQSWHGRFTLVPSRTSDEAMILVAEDVRRRGTR
jgi:16S rRNA (guanine527-N7)-methyltransferase